MHCMVDSPIKQDMSIIFRAQEKLDHRQKRHLTETKAVIETTHTVFTFRWATVDQIALVLGKSVNTVQKQLNKLCDHQIITSKPVQRSLSEKGGSAKWVYRLARKGRDLLNRHLAIDDFSSVPPTNISQAFAAHTIGNNDVRAMAFRACHNLGLIVRDWRTDYDFKSDPDKQRVTTDLYQKNGERKRVTAPIQPDQYLSIEHHTRRMDFFVEFDRGTEQLETFQKKIAGYVTYLKGGHFKQRFGHPSFRVLTVVETASDARKQALLAQTELQPRIAKRFWYTNLSDLSVARFFTQPIWTIAGSRKQARILK